MNKVWSTAPTAGQGAETSETLPGLRRWREQHVIAGGRSFPLCLVEFDAHGFNVDAFRAGGIALPPQIAGSVRKRQAEFFFGRLAARRALSACGIVPCEVAIGSSREPVWPGAVIGSISHSGHIAAAIALARSTYRGIGIDLEPVLGLDLLATVRATVLDEREYALLCTSAGAYPIDILCTLAFSAKESFFKGCFAAVRRYFDFSAVRLVGIDARARSLQLELLHTLCPELVEGSLFEVRFEFPDPDTVLTLFIW